MGRVSEDALEFDKEFIRQLLNPGVSDSHNYEITKKALRRVLQEDLTDRQREVIMLRYYQNLRVGEIADQLGVDHSTVSKHLVRAHKRLKKSLRWYIEFMYIGRDVDEV